jgi:hypothetical protein
MRLLHAYDEWCYKRLEAILLWMEEWFSISQSAVEQFLILLYVILELAGSIYDVHSFLHHRYGLTAAVALSMGTMMYFLHRRPPAFRQISRQNIVSFYMRVFLQVFVVEFSILNALLPLHQLGTYLTSLQYYVWTVFFYIMDISSNGTPGRRRKLALAKLKELFGTSWVPKPVPEAS